MVASGATPEMPTRFDGDGDRAGDVGPVPVVVDVGRIHAVGLLARPVERRQVGGEVAAQRAGEVGGDVRVGAVDAGVDHADEHAITALGRRRPPLGVLRPDHGHVPLVAGERLRPPTGLLRRAVRVRLHPGPLVVEPLVRELVAHARAGGADRAVARRTLHGGLAAHVAEELRVRRGDLRHADLGVLVGDRAPGGLHRSAAGRTRGAIGVQHQEARSVGVRRPVPRLGRDRGPQHQRPDRCHQQQGQSRHASSPRQARRGPSFPVRHDR